MDKLTRKYYNLSKAFESLIEARDDYALAMSADIGRLSRERLHKSLRDSLVQRFEYTIESLWNYIRTQLEDGFKFKIKLGSAKAVIDAATGAGLLYESEAVLMLEMAENGSLTSHLYQEDLADGLVRLMPAYYELFEALLRRLKPRNYDDVRR